MSQKKHPRYRSISAISLGCAKNRIDTEEMLGCLAGQGYRVSGDTHNAGAVIVNTCAFIDSAREESVRTLLRLAASRSGKKPLIIVAGCLAQRYGRRLLKSMPEVDGVIGVHGYSRLETLCDCCFAGLRPAFIAPEPERYCTAGPRLLTTSAHSVYIKIAEGCNNRCRYCLIPSLRGRYRSRPPQEIVEEAAALAALGAKEINLVAQDTTLYGRERGKEGALASLLEKLSAVPGISWIRLLYAHPAHLDDRVISVMASSSKICKYLDLPLQHADDDVLKAMGRPYGSAEIAALLVKLRRRIPGISLRTTFMTGFPGETKGRFNRLLAFMRRFPFEHVGAFVYEAQKGTAAAEMEGAPPRRVAVHRRRRLMAVQQDIARHIWQGLAGTVQPVMVDRVLAPGTYLGRTPGQAPEVDGTVKFRGTTGLRPGEIIPVRIFASSAYDLLGRER